MTNLPLLIPSYNRPDAPLIDVAKRVLKNEYPWFVFCRKSQRRDYLATVPSGHLVTMPDRLVPTLGDTRNWMMEWAIDHGYPQVFDWDDDVFRYGIKGPEGSSKQSSRRTGNVNPWLDTVGYWEEASRLAAEVFELYPLAVVGSIQNQRWCKPFTVQVQAGKTPRRTKILNVERMVEADLWCPEEFRFHGEDIGNTAMYLQNGWQIFTIGRLTYDFVAETDPKLPSTLRDRDEERNRAIHAAEYEALQQYDIAEYLRINKAYDDGTYMYGDVDWRKFRKFSGQLGYEHAFRPILDSTPLADIPVRIIK